LDWQIEIIEKIYNSAKSFHVEVVEGLFEAQGQGESADIKIYDIYAKSGMWNRTSLFGHGDLNIQDFPFTQCG